MDMGLTKNIKITYLGLPKEAVSIREEEISIPQQASVRELFEALIEHHKGLKPHLFAKNNALQPKVKVLLDDKDINEIGGLNTLLQNVSKVTLVEFKLLGGG